MNGRLIAVANGQLVGEITRDARGRLRFTHDAVWREDDPSYPLSLSMPLTAAGHGHGCPIPATTHRGSSWR